MGEISNNKEVTLLEVVERLLDKGVVISGDLILSVADIDLIYLNLRLVLTSIQTMFDAQKDVG